MSGRSKKNILIIGGGLAGTTLLYELSRRGEPVTLLEQAAALGEGTSHANGGMITPSMSDPWNSPGVGGHLLASVFNPTAAMKLRLTAIPEYFLWGLGFLRNSFPKRHRAATIANFALAQYSAIETLKLTADLAMAYDNNAYGTLKLYEDKQELETALALLRPLQSLGLNYQLLQWQDIIQVEPSLQSTDVNVLAGIYFPDDSHGDACKFTKQIGKKALAAGGHIILKARATKIEQRHGQVFGVHYLKDGQEQFLAAENVILATGPHCLELLKPLDIHIAIKPVKGYSLTIPMKTGQDLPKLPVIDDHKHAAITPLGHRLRLSGTAEFAGFNRHLNPQRLQALHALKQRLYPQLEIDIDQPVLEWAGLRPMSADGRPFIGQTSLPGLYVNSGHGHLGWTMAVGSAKLCSQLILGETPAIATEPYGLNR
ncbi:MAG: FAD-dependent oxidoreductase [bacterium]